MDRNETIADAGPTPGNVIALLFALAELAERAAGRSQSIRRLVLWILYPAESVARKFVLEAYGPVALPQPRAALSDDDPAAALRLAACLRMLATLLACLPDEAFADLPTGCVPFAANIQPRRLPRSRVTGRCQVEARPGLDSS